MHVQTSSYACAQHKSAIEGGKSIIWITFERSILLVCRFELLDFSRHGLERVCDDDQARHICWAYARKHCIAYISISYLHHDIPYFHPDRVLQSYVFFERYEKYVRTICAASKDSHSIIPSFSWRAIAVAPFSWIGFKQIRSKPLDSHRAHSAYREMLKQPIDIWWWSAKDPWVIEGVQLGFYTDGGFCSNTNLRVDFWCTMFEKYASGVRFNIYKGWKTEREKSIADVQEWRKKQAQKVRILCLKVKIYELCCWIYPWFLDAAAFANLHDLVMHTV